MWLLKTEPGDYSWDQLAKAGRARWDGVRNPAALGHLRQMAPGDLAFIYHTGDEKAVVGVARIVRAAYSDPKASDDQLVVVDLEPVKRLKRPVTLREIKASRLFATSPLVRQGRLSVVPLTREQWAALETGEGL